MCGLRLMNYISERDGGTVGCEQCIARMRRETGEKIPLRANAWDEFECHFCGYELPEKCKQVIRDNMISRAGKDIKVRDRDGTKYRFRIYGDDIDDRYAVPKDVKVAELPDYVVRMVKDVYTVGSVEDKKRG